VAGSYEALLAAVATSAEAPQLSPTFAQQTVALALAPSLPTKALATRPWKNRPRRVILCGSALAASVLLLLIPVLPESRQELQEPAPAWTANTTPAESVAAFDLAILHRSDEIAHAQLWQATGRNLAEIPVAFRRVTDQYERLGISDSLRPVADRLGATLEAISRLLPEAPAHSEMLNGGTGACDRLPAMRIA
jgi:hypothetical protein